MAPAVPHHRRGTGGDTGLPKRSPSSPSLNCSSTALADKKNIPNLESRDAQTFNDSPVNYDWDKESDQEVRALTGQEDASLPSWAFTFSLRKLR